jgi:SET domain-containing protein
MYKPLPKYLTIKESNIHGLGLFAISDIKKDVVFGISHVKDDRFDDGYIRTPLGGFFNHSDSPNCTAYVDGDFIKVKSIVGIKSGEEITVKYWLYTLS